jgi:hypothetical protein
MFAGALEIISGFRDFTQSFHGSFEFKRLNRQMSILPMSSTCTVYNLAIVLHLKLNNLCNVTQHYYINYRTVFRLYAIDHTVEHPA